MGGIAGSISAPLGTFILESIGSVLGTFSTFLVEVTRSLNSQDLLPSALKTALGMAVIFVVVSLYYRLMYPKTLL